MPVLKSGISTRSATFEANRKAMLTAIDTVAEASRMALDGGGEKARERHVARGKLLPRERVAQLLDPGSPFLEVGLTAGHGMYGGAAPSAGIITGIGRVSGRDCMIVCNDATVKGGTYYPVTVKNICARRRLRAKTVCPAFIWSIPVAQTCPIRMRFSRIATISGASFIIRRRCRRRAFRKSLSSWGRARRAALMCLP